MSTQLGLTAAAEAQHLDPRVQAFVATLDGAPPVYTLTPKGARDALSSVQVSAEVLLPEVESVDRTLPVGPTGRTDVRILRPADAKGPLPAIIYMHGGGWVMGDKDTHDRLVRELAARTNATIIFVDYLRSPEHRYPVAIEQSYAVLKYVAAHPGEFGIDARRIAVAGDSVGGNMSTVVALMAKEMNGPSIKAQLLFYPVTDATMSSASYQQFAEGPWLTKRGMAWFWDQYLPDQTRRAEIYVSPINASIEQLRNLPPALIVVDENDVLRDEGEAYAQRLAEAGVPVTSLRYNGMIHDFMLLNPIAAAPAVQAAVGQAAGYLRAVFNAH